MKYNCELVQDLLPLYQEGLCSPTSRQIVEEHLCDCPQCRSLTAPLPIEEPKDSPAADRAVKKSMRKVRRRWLASLIAAVLLMPILLLSFNQHRGHGLCFTNLDNVYTSWRFLHALETQDWEKAARMHDYSDAYDSIMDALSQDVSAWGIRHTPFDLAGYDYAAKGYLADNDAIPETLQDLYGFLYNLQGSAMIPLALWDQLMALDPEAFQQETQQYWLNGESYVRITTPWGEFVANEARACQTAYDYALQFDLIPAAICEEARPAIEAEARQLYSLTHAHVGWVAGLTEAEFEEEMTRRYIADLEALEGTASFDCTGFHRTGRHSDEADSWYMVFGVTITHEDRSLDTEFQITVADGKLTVSGISYNNAPQWLDSIDRALYPSAHPGY